MSLIVFTETVNSHYCQTQFKMGWVNEITGNQYAAQCLVSDEFFYHTPSMAKETITLQLMQKIESILKPEDHVGWAHAVAMTYTPVKSHAVDAMEYMLKSCNTKPVPPNTHYEDHATSEFDGVEDLDPSLWNEGDDSGLA